MKTPGHTAVLHVPSDLAVEVHAAAEQDNRTAVDVLRDALESYLECRRWERDAADAMAKARTLGLPDDDGTPSAEYRQIIGEKISAGLASARAGRLLDGEEVFARLAAKLDELERQDRG